MSRLPYKTLEKKLFNSGYGYICAVDEVGMGCLAGPVVVCAIGITNAFYNKHHKKLHWLRESKLLRPEQREHFAGELLKEKNLIYSLAYCYPKTIDKINIYQASRVAMRRAVKKVTSFQIPVASNLKTKKLEAGNFKLKTMILVDGRNKIKDLNMEQQAIVKGDRKIFAIACASIIAKVYRDKMMRKYAKKFPGYGFEKHKGYGTKFHQAKLTALGPCEIHRRSFRLIY